ncbi:MAG TPA: conjugal transfer protein MobC [Puia sp.]|nr:conjugal transfer protein MobC [Puia sp.]
MSMQTGENEQGLRKILDFTRGISIVILFLHFYFYCYQAFREWHFSAPIGDRLMMNISHTGLFRSFNKSKLIALLFLVISLVGARGRKNEKLRYRNAFIYILIGLVLFFASWGLIFLELPVVPGSIAYMGVTILGYLILLSGGTLLTRIIKQNFDDDVFNKANESFPQEERLLTNEYSINLPAQYNLKGKIKKSWINIINPFRGLLVMGSPGSGKSYFVIQHIIKQHIEKGFSMFVYDFKYDDLTKITYNQYLQNKKNYKIEPKFFSINFDNLNYSHRCNPLDVASMHDLTDAAESARTILLGLNPDWIKKRGDFWVESPINFLTAVIWFLCNYEKGKYCTLPHVIEFAQTDYSKLFSILRTEPLVEVLIAPFVTAYVNDAKQQLEGQISSATVSLSKLASPNLYYVLSGNDFTLDINNPDAPKIVCIGNNPQKTQTYGAVLSLYINALTRLMNRKGMMKSSLIFDEFPTIFFNGMDNLIATARSNKVATTMAVQDASQLKLHYGKEQADVILNIVGNIIAGQVGGETAKQLSERFGKIMQGRESVAINSQDISVTKSRQLEMAIPVSKIASLSSGEFVGTVADDPNQKIALKIFCTEIVNDHQTLEKEQTLYKELPVIAEVTKQTVMQNYLRIKGEVKRIIDEEIERMMNTPELTALIVKKD